VLVAKDLAQRGEVELSGDKDEEMVN
jgi:hypothetical protein